MFLYKQVKIFGHPVHPMLIAFPIAFYTATLASFIAYAITGDLFWFGVGYISNIAGVTCAGIAAVPGFIDLVFLPDKSRVKTTGFYHLGFHLTAFFIFFVNIFLQQTKWTEVPALPDASVPIVLSALGVALTFGGGFMGWKLVQKHHVGIDLTNKQMKVEPRDKGQLDQKETPDNSVKAA
jgi:uncharacterized membrane protein